MRGSKSNNDEKAPRIAIINPDKCKPKKCRQECKKSCPVVRRVKLCIEVTPASTVARISEELCIGCTQCTKELEKETVYRYGPNTFKLHKLLVPRPGQVLGLIGINGSGKSTAYLGRCNDPPNWQQILTYFRGSEQQNYFTRILKEK